MRLFFFFFFQAEDGIRDIGVTGVQTCALPILSTARNSIERPQVQVVGTTYCSHKILKQVIAVVCTEVQLIV